MTPAREDQVPSTPRTPRVPNANAMLDEGEEAASAHATATTTSSSSSSSSSSGLPQFSLGPATETVPSAARLSSTSSAAGVSSPTLEQQPPARPPRPYSAAVLREKRLVEQFFQAEEKRIQQYFDSQVSVIKTRFGRQPPANNFYPACKFLRKQWSTSYQPEDYKAFDSGPLTYDQAMYELRLSVRNLTRESELRKQSYMDMIESMHRSNFL